MEVKNLVWTENQQRAIDTRDKSLLVSAAAGSGKTAILVERIVKIIIEDKVDVDRLLVVTFTKAAAEEMRIRLYKKLMDTMEEEGTNRSFLNRQIAKLSGASISTLHSFCLDITKKYFQVIDLDPGLRIGDETQIGILKDKALEELLEEEYEKEDERFIDLLEMFNNRRDDQEIRNIMNKLHLFLMNRPFPKEWINKSLKNFTVNLDTFNKSNLYKEYKASTEKKVSSAKVEITQALQMANTLEGNDKAIHILQDEDHQIDLIVKNLDKGYEFYYQSLENVNFSTLRIKTEDVDLKDKIVEHRNSAKEIVKKLQESLQYHSPTTMMGDIAEMEPVIGYLLHLVLQYDHVFQEKKVERRLMDFNDMEHYTLKILQDSEVREELRKQYEFIFVDEYQDSNEIQDTIISSIMREDNVFFVGDVKQSIYRFRMADPTLFLEKQISFSNGKDDTKETIHLNQNFRSRQKIIDFINLLFENTMSQYIGEVEYDKDAKLYLGAQQAPLEEKVEITIIENDKDNIPSEELMEIGKIEGEALFIANKIKGLLKEEIYDKDIDDYRSLEYKDMVILLRTTHQWSDLYYEVLNQQGIPVYAESQTGYFDSLEIRLIIELLKLIDNSYQDIPLISVMKSPVFSFTIEELTEIRLMDKKSSFFDAVKVYSLHKNDDLSHRLKTMIEKIELWKKQCRYMPLNDFIWKLLVETGYYYYISAMPGGLQRQANVRMLIDRAKQYTESNINGLFNFIRLVESLRETKRDLTSAKIIGPNENVIRIMSIHKSKGLEFPVVFVGGLGKNMNLQDIRDSIILHKDLGVCPNYVNLSERRYCPTIYKTIAKEKLQLETLSEEMRVLYVALSRARDYLYLVGTVNKLETSIQKKWSNTLSEYSVSTARSYLDWIMPVVLKDRNDEESQEKCFTLEYKKLSEIIRTLKVEQLEGKWDLIKYWDGLKKEKKSTVYQDVNKKLSWFYDYEKESNMPTKATVTELKTLKENRNIERIRVNDIFNLPKFQRQREKTGAERGTILHFILQHLDLEKMITVEKSLKEEINDQISQMIEKQILKEEDVDSFLVPKITKYFMCPLGQRMLKAQKVYREKAFNYKTYIGDSKDYMLIQGIIDCYFLEGEEYVLIDYKSDYYSDESDMKNLIQNYTPQLDLYKRAIEELTSKNVRETYIYLFHKNEYVEIK